MIITGKLLYLLKYKDEDYRFTRRVKKVIIIVILGRPGRHNWPSKRTVRIHSPLNLNVLHFKTELLIVIQNEPPTGMMTGISLAIPISPGMLTARTFTE